MTLIVKPPGSGPNREAIRLYREILRTAKFFTWNDETGRVWSERLKESARKEFEEARYERVSGSCGLLLLLRCMPL